MSLYKSFQTGKISLPEYIHELFGELSDSDLETDEIQLNTSANFSPPPTPDICLSPEPQLLETIRKWGEELDSYSLSPSTPSTTPPQQPSQAPASPEQTLQKPLPQSSFLFCPLQLVPIASTPKNLNSNLMAQHDPRRALAPKQKSRKGKKAKHRAYRKYITKPGTRKLVQ